MGIQKVLEMVKKVNFRANYTEMGNKLIIIVPKNYHNDIKKMNKPIDVTVQELED
ncbi:MAG: hypothetical protein ACPKPY_03260 [Nitrososphaeraceae archaeon]